MIGIELEYFLEVGGAPHDSHPYPFLVFFSSPSCWMILSAWRHILLLFPNVWLPICLYVPCDTYADPVGFSLPFMCFLINSLNLRLSFHDLTTVVFSYKLHTGPLKRYAKLFRAAATWHQLLICHVPLQFIVWHVKLSAAVVSAKIYVWFWRAIFILVARTSVQEMIPSFVVFLMVMDRMVIWLPRE